MHNVCERYNLIPHPEGGFYREVFRSTDVVQTDRGERSAITSIYYCLTSGQVSKFHKLLSDEVWYWHEGGLTTLHVRTVDGRTEHRKCGPPERGGRLYVVLERGEWFCATIEPLTEYSLVSAAVAPGFDFADFTMATRAVLVLCTGNTCRSQMAEGYLNTLPGVVAMSAGVKAETEVNPHAVRVMEEAGIDISKHHPKTVESMMGLPFTDIITVCDHAAETCPMFPGAAFKHHLGVADPVGYVGSAEATLDTYRKTRDELMGLIMKWNKNS